MLSGAISKSSAKRKEISPTPTDPLKRLVKKKIGSIGTDLGRIEDVVFTGAKGTDSTPLQSREQDELCILVKRCSKKLKALERELNY